MNRDERKFVTYARRHPGKEELIALIRDSGVPPADLGKTYMAAANLLWEDDQLASALLLWEEALRYLAPARESMEIAQCETNLGAGWAEGGDASLAASHAKRGLHLGTRLQAWDLVFICASNLGSLAFDRSDFATARQYHALGLYAAEQAGEQLWIAGSLVGLAFDEEELEHPVLACRELERALPLARASGDRQLLFTCLRGLTHLTVLLRNYRAAIPVAREAIDLAATIGRAGTSGELYEELGRAYARLGDITASQEAFRHAIEAGGSGGTKDDPDAP